MDVLKELAIVDPAVVGDARAMNGVSGAWSFRHLVESIAPNGSSVGDFAQNWLTSWGSGTDLNGYPLDRPNEGRSDTMQSRIVCPWLKRSPSNACNEDCSTCVAQHLDLALAPFRLIGIFNRMDLRESELEKPRGEMRFVFALTGGPADDSNSKPLPMTVIFEFEQPATRTTKEWAQSWHALGTHAVQDAAYLTDLEALTRGVIVEGPLSKGPQGGAAVAQVRTNESYLDWIWQQRQFGISGSGALVLEPLQNTPPKELNDTPIVRSWILANKDAILANTHSLPISLRGGTSELISNVWGFDGIDPVLRKAFASQTCNGCHSQENPTVDTAFHVSPFRSGVASLSTYLYNPGGTTPDELTTRSASLQRALCTP